MFFIRHISQWKDEIHLPDGFPDAFGGAVVGEQPENGVFSVVQGLGGGTDGMAAASVIQGEEVGVLLAIARIVWYFQIGVSPACQKHEETLPSFRMLVHCISAYIWEQVEEMLIDD